METVLLLMLLLVFLVAFFEIDVEVEIFTNRRAAREGGTCCATNKRDRSE